MPVNVASHPLIAHKMTLLRDTNTSAQDFRRLLKEITFYLGYEATANIATKAVKITTPMGQEHTGTKVDARVAVVPVLRAGLGMSDAILDLMPRAAVHHIGLYRAKDSLLPVLYYERLPKGEACDVAYICDPCIATSNTIHAVVSIVKRWGAKKIVIIAAIGAQAGVSKLLELHPDVELFIGAIDENLSASGMILPGIGDAGDRQFGTPVEYEELSAVGGGK